MPAVAGGLLLYAAHPPVGWGWAGLVALVPLFVLARECAGLNRPARSGFGWGMVAGIAFFTPLLYWIAVVELVALPLLVALEALTVAAFTALLAAWGDRPWRPLVAVVLWVAVEAVRSQWPFGGFPWGVLGYSQHDGGVVLGLASVVGVLGVSAACAGVAAAVEEGVWRLRRMRGGGGWPWATAGAEAGFTVEGVFAAVRAPVLAVVGILVLGVAFQAEPRPGDGSTLDVAAMQGNDIPHSRSLSLGESRALAVADRMTALTVAFAAAASELPDVVVWPENALDADVTRGGNPEVAARVATALDALDDTPLLTGLLRSAPDGEGLLNTMTYLDPQGAVDEVYVKRSLVPFGEYVPLREYLGWVPPLERAGNLVAGDEATVFTVDDAQVGTLICFENNFPALARSLVRDGAELLIVSTNNASFGRTPASDQHIAFSQLRAVETGRWVLHAGISGKSAVIDAAGGVGQRTGLFEQAVVRQEIPRLERQTVFTRTGDLVGPTAMALGAAGLAGMLASALRRRHNGRTPGA